MTPKWTPEPRLFGSKQAVITTEISLFPSNMFQEKVKPTEAFTAAGMPPFIMPTWSYRLFLKDIFILLQLTDRKVFERKLSHPLCSFLWHPVLAWIRSYPNMSVTQRILGTLLLLSAIMIYLTYTPSDPTYFWTYWVCNSMSVSFLTEISDFWCPFLTYRHPRYFLRLNWPNRRQ